MKDRESQEVTLTKTCHSPRAVHGLPMQEDHGEPERVEAGPVLGCHSHGLAARSVCYGVGPVQWSRRDLEEWRPGPAHRRARVARQDLEPAGSEQEQKVRAGFGDDNPFAEIKVVFMEFAEPNVADGLCSLEKAGCRRIVAVPLLIAPSSHSHWDIPALLGTYSDPEVEKALREEGARLVRTAVPVTVTTTLDKSDVIERIMLKRVRQLSRDTKQEAVVLLAHGSEAIPPAWDRFMRRTVTYLCGQTGISYGDWAAVGVGQEYSRAAAAMQEAARHKDRVIVVGAYLSMGVTRMHSRWMARFTEQGGEMPGMENPLQGLNLELAEQGLLPDEQ